MFFCVFYLRANQKTRAIKKMQRREHPCPIPCVQVQKILYYHKVVKDKSARGWAGVYLDRWCSECSATAKTQRRTGGTTYPTTISSAAENSDLGRASRLADTRRPRLGLRPLLWHATVDEGRAREHSPRDLCFENVPISQSTKSDATAPWMSVWTSFFSCR